MSERSEPSELFKQGIKIRREVLGDAYVDKALADVGLASGFQDVTDAGRVLIRLGNQVKNMSRKYAGAHGEGENFQCQP